MKRISVIVLLFFTSLSLCFSQKKVAFYKDSTDYGIPFNFSYFSDLYTHPGIRFGVEKSLWNKLKEKTKRKGKIKTKTTHIFLTAGAGMYRHGGLHTGFFLIGEAGLRKIRKNGFYSDFLLGGGYLRTFNAGKTYEVTSDGQVDKVFLAGNNSYLQSFSVTMGKSFLKTRNFPFGWYLKQNFLFQIPNNSAFNMIWGAEMGFNFWLCRNKDEK